MGTLSPQFGSLIPSQTQQLLATNYLQFTNNGGGAGIPANFADFAQQYLPEVYEQEVERYGNRTLSGFLRMVGAEMPMTSDQVIWSEQNRLHIAYNDVTLGAGAAANSTNIAVPANADMVMSVNDTVVVLDPATGLEAKCIVTVVNALGAGGDVDVQCFDPVTALVAGQGFSAAGCKVFVYGSAYTKGTSIGAGAGNSAVRTSVEPSFTQFSNSPIIIRDQYVVSGSDMAQIGWIEIATEDGASGYLWYLKAESETRLRFEDYLEMVCIEGERNAGIATAGYAAVDLPGTQGLFSAIEERGNVEVGFAAASGISDFDEILRNLDTQGAIEENMLFLQRQTALDFDDMLAGISAGGNGGTAYGLFENSEEMALNLGFSGFRRGSYDFYKTDWKYLNDASTRGGIVGINSIEGVLIPAGTSTVYDQILGTNIRRPFLHVRYRASQADDRRMKSWVTGSAGGAFTSTLDAMEVNFLSERCLVTQAANNFVLFKGI
jgi:hypothetical protein|tara:strand:+ start:1212 stop:2687 length:1476 start_codon:yes stop_codon:yes gene_type:complete